MAKQTPSPGCRTYQIKTTVKDIEPAIWRRIQIPGDCTLGDLHDVIQDIMGWECAHMHEFLIGQQKYGPQFEDEDDSLIDEDTVTLEMALGSSRKKFTYIYDFGDGWEVVAEVEKRLNLDEELEHAVCLAGARRGPCEDSGGPWGYLSKLEALQDPEHPEHAEIVEWMGDDWDPEYFDLDEINEQLATTAEDMDAYEDMDEDERDAIIEQMLNDDPFLEERVMRLHNKIAEVFGIEPGDDMHAFVENLSADDLKDFAEKHLAGNPLEAAHEYGLLALTAEDLDEKLDFAKKALELDPQSVDARIVMANDSILDGDPGTGITMLRDAISVAEAKLGQKFFLKHRGAFGERIEARPYLRALLSLARVFRLTGNLEQATRVYEELLDLDPDDHSGAHYGLVGSLLLAREYHKARVLIDRYQEDEDPALAWASVLVQYAVLGAKAAKGELEEAIEAAPLVAACLLDPDTLDDLDFSSMDGHCAFVALESFSEAWQECPGAIDWLSKFVYGGKKN